MQAFVSAFTSSCSTGFISCLHGAAFRPDEPQALLLQQTRLDVLRRPVVAGVWLGERSLGLLCVATG